MRREYATEVCEQPPRIAGAMRQMTYPTLPKPATRTGQSPRSEPVEPESCVWNSEVFYW